MDIYIIMLKYIADNIYNTCNILMIDYIYYILHVCVFSKYQERHNDTLYICLKMCILKQNLNFINCFIIILNAIHTSYIRSKNVLYRSKRYMHIVYTCTCTN